MFDIFFGWRKASKCKKLIKLVQCRLKLLKNKRYSIVRQIRDDVAQLIKIGHEQIAFKRAEQLFRDENIIAVYELLDQFCEFIIINLSYIRRNKDCPNDINEAVSSLVFASARCGDLPELRLIRKLFGDRYGQRLVTAAVELLPGNLVNRQITEKLSIKLVPDDAKHKLVDEIARNNCLRPEILALEYTSELQQQAKENYGDEMLDTSRVKENYRNQVLDTDFQTDYRRTEGSQIQASNVDEIEGKEIHVDSCHAYSHQNSEMISTSISSSIVQQSSLDVPESPMHNKAVEGKPFSRLDSPCELAVFGLGNKESRSTYRVYTTSMEHKRITAGSSSDGLPQLPEETVVYLDDIEEFQSSMTNGDCQDQRLFKFKQSVQPKGEKFIDGCDESYMDHYEACGEKSSSRSSRKSRKASGKRSRRRSLSREVSCVKDIECVIYYEKPCKSSPYYKDRSHQKKSPVEESDRSYYTQKRLKPCGIESGRNFQSSKCKHNPIRSSCVCCFNHDCSIEHPCYFCAGIDKDDCEVPPSKQKREISSFVGFPPYDLKCKNLSETHRQCFKNGVSDKEMEWAKLAGKQWRRSYDDGASVYQVFTYPDEQPKNHKKKTKGTAEGSNSPGTQASSNGFCGKVMGSWTRKETPPPYLRAITMPQERLKDSRTGRILRSNSCPDQYPNHVHPKLPDYDDIAGKFMALKKENLQSKCH